LEDQGWAIGMKVDGRNGGTEKPGEAEGLKGPGMPGSLWCSLGDIKDEGPVFIWWWW